MKTLFRILVLGTMLTAFGALSAFAQDFDLAAKFDEFKKARVKPCGERDAALTVGKEINAYGSDEKNKEVYELNKPVFDYVKKQVDLIEKEDPDCKMIAEYNKAYPAKDWNKFMTLSKQIIAKEGNSPLALDVMLTFVSTGYDQAVAKNDTYNAETINYARQAIQRIEAGGTSQTGNWGTFNGFKTKTFPDGKSNSLNWMNYIIGWINYNRLGATDPNKKKEGLVYLYKSTLVKGEMAADHTIYTNIGSWYFDQAATLDEEYRKLREANNNVENDEAKAKLALARGFAERAIDAFGRARQIATQNKATPKVVEAITQRLGELYRFRFNMAPTAPTPDLEKYVSGMLTKPMPDPATDVMPVVEEVKPTTTTTTTTSTTTPTTTTPTKATTTTTTKQPTSTTTKTTPVTTTATTNKATTTKKPVTKKKGTR